MAFKPLLRRATRKHRRHSMCNSTWGDMLSQLPYFKSRDESSVPDQKFRLLEAYPQEASSRSVENRVQPTTMTSLMILSPFITFLLLGASFMSITVRGGSSGPGALNLTAISAQNGQSIFECWQLEAPFVDSTQAGTDGAVFAQLGNATNASFAILPPKFNGGLHNAPCVQ